MELIKAFIFFVGIFSSISLLRTLILELIGDLDIFEGSNRVMNLSLFTSFIWAVFYTLN